MLSRKSPIRSCCSSISDELDRTVALNQLGTDLVAEHHLRRVSARHTEIEVGAQP